MDTNTTNNTVARVFSTTAKVLSVALALAAGSIAAGCIGTQTVEEPPMIIGEWESEETVCGENSWIEMDDDLSGEARIFFYFYGECVYADYDVEVDDMSDDEYEIEFKIEDRSLASELDFEMECEVEDDDEIECEGSDAFGDFEWVFERD